MLAIAAVTSPVTLAMLYLKPHTLLRPQIRDPIDSFRTFNQFFFRELKPGARPIASPTEDSVIVSCADCRLIVRTGDGQGGGVSGSGPELVAPDVPRPWSILPLLAIPLPVV